MVPTIGIGNLVVGGTGKTPFTLWLAKELTKKGFKPIIVAGGYKRKSIGVCRVVATDMTEDASKSFGDEPSMVAVNLPDCPVWVGKKWMAASIAGGLQGFHVVLVDDAFQHRKLKKNAEIVLIDAHYGFGNGLFLPFGPLRDSIDSIKRAAAIVFVGTSYDVCDIRCRRISSFIKADVPIFYARKKICGIKLSDKVIGLEFVCNLPLLAFAGISKPQTFFHHLQQIGLDIRKAIEFPDHYFYSEDDIVHLIKEAQRAGARLIVCTEKDYYKIPHKWRSSIGCVLMVMEVHKGDKLVEFVLKNIKY